MVYSLQVWIFFLLSFAVFVVAGWALVDAMTRPPAAFVSAGKRTKGFWLAVTGAATAIGFVAIPQPLGLGLLGSLSFVGLLAVVAGGVYLADVRPAVRQYPRGGRGRTGGGGPSRGW